MTTSIQKYLTAFNCLKQGVTQYGPAPHKPILLLSLIELIEKGLVPNNQFEVNADLVATFKENWLLLVTTLHQADFTQPFYHLQTDKVEGKPFWVLQPYLGMQINAPIKSVLKLSQTCAFGHLDPHLFMLLTDVSIREVFKTLLLERYFASNKSLFIEAKIHGEGYLHDQEEFVLNEPEAKYKRIIINTEEDVFVRNGLFKKLVPKIYGNQCSFTGMQLSSTFGHSFIDACHIVPFSQTHDDKVTNGIALCPNLHRAFDRGLVSISTDFTILVSDHVIEQEAHAYALKGLSGRRILLPNKQIHFPDRDALEWHREHVFKS
ncbi:restriction endonuclease [Pedobacter yonginense]|uniref:Restriction endonuclease n=1 Tax=Pedobacter yonginense TaxID=651869 RepID=A0A317EMF3_9SPHI|nr:HNH endonuclease [Pedobacter yonginense]PWS27991.1 restriction endonuclease [Pedobacter yonginense]